MTNTGPFGEGFDLTPGNPAGFMAYSQQLGLSATAALEEWRNLGGTASDTPWYRMYGQVANALANVENAASLDPTQIPGQGDYAEWSMGGGGQYATQVGVIYREPDTGVEGVLQYTYVTNDPHTPAEAEAAAMADYGSDENAAQYGQTIVGPFTINVYQTTPFEMTG